MGKSVWFIVVFGLLATAGLAIAMFLTLEMFQQSAAGSQSKTAEAVQAKFKFESVIALVIIEEGRPHLGLRYSTTQGLPNAEGETAQMTEVAQFAIGTYDGKDKRLIEEIRVTRRERRGAGFWVNTYESRHTIPNPFKGMPEPKRPPSTSPQR